MRALLIRIGVDQAYGGWNAPADPASRRFLYCPIPDHPSKCYRPGCKRDYGQFVSALDRFLRRLRLDGRQTPCFPSTLLDRHPHLDPDFEHLTYGDNGQRRGAGITEMERGDLLAFYGGLRSVAGADRLIYALVGLYAVDQVIPARHVAVDCCDDNAHNRWTKISNKDVVVRANPKLSGRLERCIPIGEWRDRAYRVQPGILKAWGGLSVRDGYIQRSAVPPRFLNPDKFYLWFLRQGIPLVRRNN